MLCNRCECVIQSHAFYYWFIRHAHRSPSAPPSSLVSGYITWGCLETYLRFVIADPILIRAPPVILWQTDEKCLVNSHRKRLSGGETRAIYMRFDELMFFLALRSVSLQFRLMLKFCSLCWIPSVFVCFFSPTTATTTTTQLTSYFHNCLINSSMLLQMSHILWKKLNILKTE